MTGSASSSRAFCPDVLPGEVVLRNALLLDVRTPVEFEESHIEGSTLLPLHELTPEAVAAAADGKGHCVLICSSGGRARQAAEKLAGRPGLQVLRGGLRAWEAAGLPVKRGKRGKRRAIPLERQVRIAAGVLVLTGTALGFFLSPAWLVLPAFVGTGLIFAGVTDYCGMALLLARMPWNR